MPKVSRPATFLALAVALVANPGGASAYHIRHMGAQHEIFTVLAEECLLQLGPRVLQQKCPWPPTTAAFDKTHFLHSSWGGPVRWPDDVMRRTSEFHPIQLLKLGYLELGGCRHRLKQPGYPGLQCDSDMGRLQFFHAMGPRGMDARTRLQIRAWTKLSFDVATGKVDGTANLCSKTDADPDLKEAFRGTQGYCSQSTFKPGPTVREFFASMCRRSCKLVENADEASRRTALGAIMHLVQDSFSQSHAARGGRFPYGPYTARVVCLPVEQFYAYDEWQQKVHPPGDRTPTLDWGCATSAIADPITATARLMWLWQNNCDSSWAVELMDNGVLGGSAPARVPASPAQCRVATTAV